VAREGRRRGRLSRSGDFDRVFREGSSHSNRYLVLYAFPRTEPADEPLRLGVSVGRKVGGAVERNRAKRSLREAFWELAERLPEGYDFVLVARPDVGGLIERGGTAAAREALEELLAQARLGHESNPEPEL
jgi:ribonuclease P protein component